jgi:hypothetical protein
VAGSCENGTEPTGSIKGGKFVDSVATGFSRRTLLHEVS